MKLAFRVLIGLTLLQGTAFALQGPEIQVVDGKITMTAQGVPLAQLLTMLDRATGLNSQVLKPEASNRNISVRFTGLDLKEAVRKIFEGQPLNYILREGKGIIVTDQAEGGTTTSTISNASSSFPAPQPINQLGVPGVGIQPAPNAGPQVQIGNPQQNPANTNSPNSPFGAAPAPANPTPTGPGQAGATPGQISPPQGGNNPLIGPAGASSQGPAPAPAGVNFPGVQPSPTGGLPFPGPQAGPAPQPSGPGASGATPGTIR